MMGSRETEGVAMDARWSEAAVYEDVIGGLGV